MFFGAHLTFFARSFFGPLALTPTALCITPDPTPPAPTPLASGPTNPGTGVNGPAGNIFPKSMFQAMKTAVCVVPSTVACVRLYQTHAHVLCEYTHTQCNATPQQKPQPRHTHMELAEATPTPHSHATPQRKPHPHHTSMKRNVQDAPECMRA